VAACALALGAGGCGGDDGSPAAKRAKPLPPVPSDVSPSRLAALHGGGPLIGLADNRPETLTDPRFAATGIKRVRVVVPYDDVARGGERVRELDAYFDAAKAKGLEVLVSFYRSYLDKDRLPTPAEYRRDFRLFRKRYPQVKLFSTWNEANFAAAQPTGRDPALTARFYRIARDECSGGRCTVLAADFRADGSRTAARWLATFRRGIGPGPHRWGLVSYPDVTRRTAVRTREFLRSVEGPVWVTEVGAINFFGKGLRPSESRQTRVMRYLMYDYPKVSGRLERMYVYHWRAAPGDTLFDSGLLNVDGTPRPAYDIFFKALGKTPPN
jgi:polysaccharide biosynthesis protein PslG